MTSPWGQFGHFWKKLVAGCRGYGCGALRGGVLTPEHPLPHTHTQTPDLKSEEQAERGGATPRDSPGLPQGAEDQGAQGDALSPPAAGRSPLGRAPREQPPGRSRARSPGAGGAARPPHLLSRQLPPPAARRLHLRSHRSARRRAIGSLNASLICAHLRLRPPPPPPPQL